MRIAVDLDGVCYDWEGTVRYLLREYRGVVLEGSRYWDDLPDHTPKADWAWLWDQGIEYGMFRHGHVIKGAIEGVRALQSSGHEIILATHRPASGIMDTMRWITLHFQGVKLAGVHLLTNREPKTSVDADVLVDDKMENIEQWTDAGRDGILFGQPWNQLNEYMPAYKAPGSAWRVEGWPEVVRLVREMEEDEATTDDLAVNWGTGLGSFLRAAATNTQPARRDAGPDWPSYDRGPDCG